MSENSGHLDFKIDELDQANQLLMKQRLGGSQSEISLNKKLARPPSQPISWVWWQAPVIPDIWDTSPGG
jgi:hypothetical protein